MARRCRGAQIGHGTLAGTLVMQVTDGGSEGSEGQRGEVFLAEKLQLNPALERKGVYG